MEYYIGWSHSDALYSDTFRGCPMLISAVPENHRPLRKFLTKPKRLIVDSGALYYNMQDKPHTLADIFNRQLELIQDASEDMEITLVHVDKPMINQNTISQRYAAMERTILNAFEYIRLFQKQALSDHVKAMGVIQGFDNASIRYSAQELTKIGYQLFGLGSLLGRSAEEQIEWIELAAKIVGGERLHVFGVTGIPQIRKMIELGIMSFDSTRPTMVAAYYQVFYSDPFRTYVLSDSKVANRNNTISTPLPCDCPVCRERPQDILISSPRKYMKLRSLHNYYHFVRTIQQLIDERRGSDVISDVLWTRD